MFSLFPVCQPVAFCPSPVRPHKGWKGHLEGLVGALRDSSFALTHPDLPGDKKKGSHHFGRSGDEPGHLQIYALISARLSKKGLNTLVITHRGCPKKGAA